MIISIAKTQDGNTQIRTEEKTEIIPFSISTILNLWAEAELTTWKGRMSATKKQCGFHTRIPMYLNENTSPRKTLDFFFDIVYLSSVNLYEVVSLWRTFLLRLTCFESLDGGFV